MKPRNMNALQVALLIGPLALGFEVAQASGIGCFRWAAATYHVDEPLLRAMARVESRYVSTAVHYDADGSRDVGVMQINSSHFAALRRDYGIDEAALLQQPCLNVAVGASILSGFVARYGMTWRAVGAYGAGTAANKEAARRTYASLVGRALEAEIRPHKPGLVVAIASVGAPSASAQPRMLVLE